MVHLTRRASTGSTFSSICSVSALPFSASDVTPACVIYDIIVRPHGAGPFRGLASRYEMRRPVSLTSGHHDPEFLLVSRAESAIAIESSMMMMFRVFNRPPSRFIPISYFHTSRLKSMKFASRCGILVSECKSRALQGLEEFNQKWRHDDINNKALKFLRISWDIHRCLGSLEEKKVYSLLYGEEGQHTRHWSVYHRFVTVVREYETL